MSYTSGFFDAVDLGGGNYDREYSAAVFAHYFSLLIKNGVFPDPSTGMQVKASSNPDMHVSVQPGSGWINGYYITVLDDSPEVLTVPTANPSLSRIDSVIMGLNYVEREIQLYIKSGAVSASPSAVSLQRDNDLYEMELAQITIAAGMASISQANITDMRQNTSRCGIVKGTIDQIDTTDLFAQYDDAFQTWFEDLQSQMSGDVATNLQNQISTLELNKVNKSDRATLSEALAGTDNEKWMSAAISKQQFDSLSVRVESVGLYLSLCGNVNPDMLDAAFGKPDDGLRGIGSALAKFSWFKGDSKDTYPHTLLQTKTSFSSCLADPDAVVDIINTSSIFAIVKSSPYAKALLEQAYPTYIKGALAAVGYTYVSLDQSLSTVSSSVDFLAAVDRTANPASTWDILLYSMNLYDSMKAKTGYDGMVASKPFLRQMYDKDDFTTKVENDATNFHNAAMKSNILIMKTNVEVNKVLYNNKCFVVHASENRGGGGKSHYSMLKTTKQGGTIYTGEHTTMFEYDSFNAMKVLEPRASISYGAKIGYIPLT